MPTWIHLSDLHLCAQKTGWDADRILKFLLDDLRLMERDHGLSPDLLLVSGDLAFGHLGDGGLSIQAQFEEVARFLRDVRNAFKRPIPSDRVFLVPGNHDVVRQKVLDSQTKYLDSLASDDPSKSINAINQLLRDASGEWPPLMQRLDAYREFLREHYPHLLQDEKRLCYAILLEIDGTRLGIGGISSAWSCGRDQEKGKLWLGGKWQFSTLRGKLDDADVRLALAHHPLTWLVPQENPALDPELEHSFHFFLHGHEHQAWVDEKQGHVRIAAGACYGESPRESGYSLVRLNRSEGKGEVWLRRFSDEGIGWIPRAIPGRTNNDGMWSLDIAHLRTTTTQPAGNLQEPPTADANRLLEVSTTNAPTSYGVFGDPAESRQTPGQSSNPSGGLAGTEDLVEAYLSGELQEALMAFSSQPKIWIEPTLCTCAEIERDCPTRRHVSASDFVVSVRSTIIKAPPQFGLTCLARHLVLQAWRLKVPSRWVYLDARSLTSSRTNVQKVASAELAHTGHRIEDAKCIVLDSLQSNEKAQLKILKTVCDVFPSIPVVVMQSVDVRSVLSALDGAELGREFDVLYLWALSREHIRELVVTYNEERHIGEEDSVTSRIAADLVALNIHRTPLNCLTVLKASEMDFSESPVNRTEMLGRVLFILFNVDAIPRYKLRPDMKDCEYVLGYFCEQLIRENTYFFARDKFLEDLRAFCQKRVMLMDVDALFDILHGNHIVVAFGSLFCFRFTYWVYYFAAQRMHHDAAFAEFVLSDMMYARFPEVIEFYTGIDRRRADALKILTEDLQRGIGLVKVKCGLPDDVNVYPFLQWQPTVAGLEAMRNEISNGVAASNLPDVIKERYADRGYDRARPYDQAVRDVLSGDSLASVMLSMSAGARALRNSDYVDPQVRRALLDQILLGWKELTRVLWVLLPLLAERQSALFDGIVFRASSEFGSTLEERFRRILMAIPENVVSWYRDDLYSPKMGPLLLQTIGREVDDLTKHELALILIAKRPAGWRAQIENYVNNISKNSFYLFDVNRRLRTTYQFAFLSLIEVRDLEYLIKMTATKHVHGIKRPGVRAIKRVPNSVLPDRSGTDEANRGQTTNT